MMAGDPENYIDFLEREFSGEAPPTHDVADRPTRMPTGRPNWGDLRSAIAPRSRLGPIFGVTQRDIDRAWGRLSSDPDLLVPRQRLGKRVLDLIVAGFCLVIFMPVFIAILIAIRIDSPGPAIFRQTRIGAGGRPFVMYKFRTMSVDAERLLASLADGMGADGILFKMRDNPRITRVGGFLRRFSLDELPQLINVLRGDMSLVGPRAALSAEVARYDRVTRRRLLVKPGLTGLWQVSGRSDMSWDEAVQLDLHYVDSWGLAVDFVVLFRTVAAIFSGRSG